MNCNAIYQDQGFSQKGVQVSCGYQFLKKFIEKVRKPTKYLVLPSKELGTTQDKEKYI